MKRFIVGTGRCGSTLLSNMLAENRRLLSLSEFFSTLDRSGIFSEEPCDGAGLVEILSRSNLANDMLIEREALLSGDARHGYRREVTEYARQGWRLPGIALGLSYHAEDPQALWAELREFCLSFPRRKVSEHFLDIADWLLQRLDRSTWIERSGVSMDYMDRLRNAYPDARFLHIHRDGPTTALAIRAHRHLALFASFSINPPSQAEMDTVFREPIDADTDPIVWRMTRDLPTTADFGRYWSWQIAAGYREFLKLAPGQLLEIRYEDLIGDTAATLRKVVEFFELPDDEGWIARASSLVDPEVIENRLAAMDPHERAALDAACRPGMTLLGRDTINGMDLAMDRARQAFNNK